MKQKAVRYLPGAIEAGLPLIGAALVGAGIAAAGKWPYALVAVGSMLFVASAIDAIAGALRND